MHVTQVAVVLAASDLPSSLLPHARQITKQAATATDLQPGIDGDGPLVNTNCWHEAHCMTTRPVLK